MSSAVTKDIIIQDKAMNLSVYAEGTTIDSITLFITWTDPDISALVLRVENEDEICVHGIFLSLRSSETNQLSHCPKLTNPSFDIGSSTLEYTVLELLPSTLYTISVRPYFGAVVGELTTLIATTRERVSASIQLQADWTADSVTVTLTWEDQPIQFLYLYLRDKNHGCLRKYVFNIRSHVELQQSDDCEKTVILTVTSANMSLTHEITDLLPNTDYTLELATFEGSDDYIIRHFRTNEKAPLEAPPGTVAKSSLETKSKTSLSVFLKKDFFTNSRNGDIISVGLIVSSAQHKESFNNEKASLSISDYENYRNWHSAKDNNFNPYRSTPIGWKFTEMFVVGADENCPTADDSTDFCNGPLDSGVEYFCKAFACTLGGCTETHSENIGTTNRDDLSLIIGLSVGIVVCIFIIVVVVMFVCLRRGRNSRNLLKTSSDGLPMSTNHPDTFLTNSATVTHREANHGYMGPTNSNKYIIDNSVSPYEGLEDVGYERPVESAEVAEANDDSHVYNYLTDIDDEIRNKSDARDVDGDEYENLNSVEEDVHEYKNVNKDEDRDEGYIDMTQREDRL